MALAAVLPLAAAGSAPAGPGAAAVPEVQRVTTAVPFPRGLVMLDGDLYVLARGRVRGVGGVSAEVDDRAGTIFRVDPDVAEPLPSDGAAAPVGAAVRRNGTVVAEPTAPPFRLWDRTARPPERDRATDRPYCTLRWHEGTRSFYLCAFSGIDKPRTDDDPVAFSKNRTDAVLRYDLRTRRWHEVERHDPEAHARYPHADPRLTPPPHGWLNGPDNCLVVGDRLYVVAKENSRLACYDLSALVRDPHAGPPPGAVVLEERIAVRGPGASVLEQVHLGHSMLAARDGWLYIGFRTTSTIVRVPLAPDDTLVRPVVGELVARFDPYDPATHHSANLTDMGFDDAGRLYVVSAQPARVYRFTPDPGQVYDARGHGAAPWIDLAAVTRNPRMKSENLLFHAGWLYVSSGDGYAYQDGADGTVYRVRVEG